MEIKEVREAEEKAAVVARILADLPAWFGLPEVTAEYIESARSLVCLVAEDDDQAVGFVLLSHPFEKAAEIYAMGILASYHRQGIGQQLMSAALAWCRSQEILFLQVKTLAASHPDVNYKKTRLFYESQGFTELEVFPTLWGSESPCLQLIRQVN